LRTSSGPEVSARVRGLIERRDGGNRAIAAIRLGIKPDLLDGLLSGDWRQFSLDALVAVIRAHGVTIDWLLGSTGGSWQPPVQGSPAFSASNIEPEGLS
jgi:hypothetical protein